MSGRMEFDVRFDRTDPEAAFSPRSSDDTPMRILILADLRGRKKKNGSDGPPAIGDLTPVPIDARNFDSVISRLAPKVVLPFGGDVDVEIGFGSLNDFHPDRLYKNLEVFRALRRTRAKLKDPLTFTEAMADMEAARAPAERPAQEEEKTKQQGRIQEGDEETLDRLLGRSNAPLDRRSPRTSTKAVADSTVGKLVKDLVAPYIVPAADAKQAQCVASVDRAIATQMRAVLHDENFQSLESTWRGIHWLVNFFDNPNELTVHLVDLSKSELKADLIALQSGNRSFLYKLLVEDAVGSFGGQPWSSVVGLFTFGEEPDDIALLQTIGAIASQARAPFLAAADPRLLGCDSMEAAVEASQRVEPNEVLSPLWNQLRETPVASWIGLALPRVLLRLPYDKRNNALQCFEFEELSNPLEHKNYLWGNPALACAMLIAAAFRERGWSMTPGDCLEIDDLPVHVFEEAGQTKMKPCTEVFLSDQMAEQILNLGIMPLISHQDRDIARLARFQSIACPYRPLSGPW